MGLWRVPEGLVIGTGCDGNEPADGVERPLGAILSDNAARGRSTVQQATVMSGRFICRLRRRTQVVVVLDDALDPRPSLIVTSGTLKWTLRLSMTTSVTTSALTEKATSEQRFVVVATRRWVSMCLGEEGHLRRRAIQRSLRIPQS
ncbi:MAG: hypothetical protein IZT58_14845 [Actinobacteria bacterium]|nr:hypothetical protein [Actinomycetota bacterium]